MSAKVGALLNKLEQVRRSGEGWTARCPAHADKQPSLSVSVDADKVLLHCHAGCDSTAVLDAVGLAWGDLSPDGETTPTTTRKQSRIVETYPYHDAGGTLLFEVVRFEPKDFLQRRPDGNGGWTWDLKGIRRVLYRLPTLRPAIERGETVFVCEGEKDVHALQSLGLTATTNPGGVKKWNPSHSESLRDSHVVILPDNDEPGRDHAEAVARSLHGIAESVRIVELPNLPNKGDVSDWIAAGGTTEELNKLVSGTPTWTPKAEPEKEEDRPLTDLTNAEALIAAHGDKLRYDVDAGKWLVWTGKLWRHDTTGEVDRLAVKVVRSYYDLLKDTQTKKERDALYDHAKKSESSARLEAMVNLARYRPGVPVQSKDLDSDPMLLNCANGTLDLRTGQLRAHRQSDLITKIAPVVYNPKAEAPRWTRFLSEVFQNDADLIAFARRMCGYLLTGDIREQCCFIFTGKGSNGKSTLVEVLRRVLGGYMADSPMTTFTDQRDANTSDLAALVGMRCVTASEGEESQTFNESLLKRLSGGDTVTCRHLYREYFTYTPTYKVLFSTNEVPRIRSMNYAMKRRIRLIPFRQRFYDPDDGKEPVKDDELLKKLLAEAPGVLSWCVQGCLEWQRGGLKAPEVVRREVEALFESHDPLCEFLESRCVISPRAQVESGRLWRAYLDWCTSEDRSPAFKRTDWFTRNLTARDGVESGRDSTRTKRILRGVGLLSDDTPPELLRSDRTPSDAIKGFYPKPSHEGAIQKSLPNNPEWRPVASVQPRGDGESDAADDTSPDTCCVCGAEVERYSPDGQPYCEEHYPNDDPNPNPDPPPSAKCPRCGTTLGLGGAADWCCKCYRRIGTRGSEQ